MGGRFTPTCVGKTRALSSPADQSDGSPPHAWGRRPQARANDGPDRFTPTCVGKTSGDLHGLLIQDGSPPHAWGRLGVVLFGQDALRFTPTCVGKTYRIASAKTPLAVHPHMRGEDRYGDFHGGHAALGRFTPTCVGKTDETGHFNNIRRPRFTPTCVGKTLEM